MVVGVLFLTLDMVILGGKNEWKMRKEFQKMRNRLMPLVLAVIFILGSSMPAWAAEEDVLENEMEDAAWANVNLLDDYDVPGAENEAVDIQENSGEEEHAEGQAITVERNSDSASFSEVDANGLKWEVTDGVLRISGNGVIEQNPSFTNDDNLRKSITSIIIEEDITGIGRMAFREYHNLKEISIPESVREIGQGAFASCGLTSVTLPNGLTEIGNIVFGDCRALSEIVIPDSVTKIDVGAFGGCTGLIKVIIPDSVKSIGEMAFYLSGLKTIVFQGDAPEVSRGTEVGPFNSVTATVYYPLGNKTYTEELKTRYEGSLTWEEREPLEIILEATDDIYKKGSLEDASITCNGVCEDFVSLSIDGNKVNESNYTSKSGSTVIDINANYLDTLELGKHIVTLNYIYGSIDAELTIISEDKIPLRIILETTKNTHVLGTSDTATITCTGELKDFVNVYVEGSQVDTSNYTLAEGSTILTFTAQYLNSLSVGTHPVTMNYTYGSVDTELIILSSEDTANTAESIGASGGTGANVSVKSATARTGDNTPVLLWLLTAITAAVSIGMVFVRKCFIHSLYRKEYGKSVKGITGK